MKIQLWSNDLVGRMRLESVWKAAGFSLLKKTAAETPDCIVIDLGLRDALARIAQLRASHPQVAIVAFGAKFDEAAFKAAKEAGATELAALNSIVERIARRFPLANKI